MAKVLIIGGDSYIGQTLHSKLIEQGDTVVATQRKNSTLNNYLDLSTPLANSALLSQPYDAVVFLAAMTNISQCRDFPQQAQQLNVTNTLELLNYFSRRNIFSIFMSTNQVFSCQKPNVHWQTEYQPCSLYGELKAEVEKEIYTQSLNVAIVRPTKVIGVNFLLFEQWQQTILSKTPLLAFKDHFIAPISLSFLCKQLIALIQTPENITIQLSGAKDISYYQLAQVFAEQLNLSQANITAISAVEKGVIPLPYGSLEPFYGSNIAGFSDKKTESISAVIADFKRGICA
ncbi:hypothetical protein A9Q74_14165 [Colwellia sp. 39_35_sub15_T18]|nr:hypothetical protein A9Q74_14165 [Colwellia sp. 39_35_sub15_T18]